MKDTLEFYYSLGAENLTTKANNGNCIMHGKEYPAVQDKILWKAINKQIINK